MDLRGKLRRFNQQAPAGAHKPRIEAPSDSDKPTDSFTDEKAARLERLRSLIGQVKQRDGRRRTEPNADAGQAADPGRLPGKEIITEYGPLQIVERWLEPEHRHGKVPVRAALEASPATVAELALDPCLAEVDLERLLILDTETTGLSGGTGTVPFLIGMAWFEQGVLRTEQLLLKSFGGEAPLLHRLAERLAWASCILSYNGKSFDWPLLRTRFILNRIAAPKTPPHLDLLHCVRRVFKPRIGEVRLTEVEKQVLGFYRDNDVDGSEIPGIYLRFLRGADPATLAPIIEHNAHDLIALAAILGKVARHFESVQPSDDPVDHLAYARVAARAQNTERALSFARAAAEGGGSEHVEVDALVLTAKLTRRHGDPGAAVAALQKALEAATDPQVMAQIHLELAKLYEHKLRDPERAREHALYTGEAEGDEPRLKRLARLEKKLSGSRT